jgi:hypothetical protein
MFYRSREASVQHDKFFGFLGLSQNAENAIIDYSIPLAECFVRNTVAWIQTTKKLDIFDHLCSPKAVLRLEDLPSWVPDFQQELSQGLSQLLYERSRWLQFFGASKDIKAAWTYGPPRMISLSGLHIDRIKATGQARTATGGTEPIRIPVATEWRDLAFDGRDPRSLYRSGCNLMEAFLRTMNFDLSARGPTLRRVEGVVDLRVIVKWWSTVREGKYQGVRVEPEHQGVERQGNIVNTATEQRRFIITDKGYMGLAPTQAQVGDLVYVFLGGKTPYVLRQAPSGDFVMIGSAYVHGFMDGEAIDMMQIGVLKVESVALSGEPLPA